MLGCNQSTIDHHLHGIQKVNKLVRWLPHQATSDNIQQVIIICNFLLSKCDRHRFHRQLVTSDDKWVLYVDHTRKCQWINPEYLPEPEPKNDLHPKKVVLSIWWNFKGIVYWKFSPRNTTIDAKHCQQLDNLKAALQVNYRGRRKVRLVHDNARLRTASYMAKAGRIREGDLTPSIIFARSSSLRLSSVPFAPQSSSHKTFRQ